MSKHTRSELRTLKMKATAEMNLAISIANDVEIMCNPLDRGCAEYKFGMKIMKVINARKEQAVALLQSYKNQASEVGSYPKKKKVKTN